MSTKNNRLINHDDAIEVNLAAKKYHYHPKTLRRWLDANLVSGFRFRGRFYLYEKQLKEYLKGL